MTYVDHEKLMEEAEYKGSRGDFEKPTQVAHQPDERTAFEMWQKAEYPQTTCSKYKDGSYRAIETQQNWIGWQAAWELLCKK